jgi:hypothetical protein
MVHQQGCSPLEYLIRLRLWDYVFANAPEPIGLTARGQFVCRQQFVTGDPASQVDVDQYLFEAGLEPVKQNRWLWMKPYPNEDYDVWVRDARSDNFVLTDFGLVPIDLRLWFAVPRVEET